MQLVHVLLAIALFTATARAAGCSVDDYLDLMDRPELTKLRDLEDCLHRPTNQTMCTTCIDATNAAIKALGNCTEFKKDFEDRVTRLETQCAKLAAGETLTTNANATDPSGCKGRDDEYLQIFVTDDKWHSPCEAPSWTGPIKITEGLCDFQCSTLFKLQLGYLPNCVYNGINYHERLQQTYDKMKSECANTLMPSASVSSTQPVSSTASTPPSAPTKTTAPPAITSAPASSAAVIMGTSMLASSVVAIAMLLQL